MKQCERKSFINSIGGNLFIELLNDYSWPRGRKFNSFRNNKQYPLRRKN